MMAATAQNNNSRCFVDEETSAALSAVEKAKAAVKESSGRLLRIMYIELFEDQIPAAIYQLFKGQCSLLELSPERVVDSFKDRNLAIKSIDKSPF